MITANVYNRVFFISAAQYGTAFTIDVDDRQYLISARHVIGDLGSIEAISVFHDKTWKILEVKPVGVGEGMIDISVLAPSIRLSPKLELEPTSKGIILGQDVFFVGYPYKMWTDAGDALGGRPCPFIKKGILSSSFSEGDGIQRFYGDAINNEGFSGGPVVFTEPGKFKYKVAAVVSGFRIEHEAVIDRNGDPTGLTVAYNTGFLLAYGIVHALTIIKSNPIGLLLRDTA